MSKLKYVKGWLKHLFSTNVSILALVDDASIISKKARIGRKCKVLQSSIGNYSYLGRGSSLIHAEVGNFCSISGNVLVGMGHHTLNHLSTSPIFTECYNGTGQSWTTQSGINPYNKVIVGNDVWIGTRVMIIGGVNIGDGAVIGAGAIVTKDVPPFAVVVGVPARVVKYRFSPETVEKIQASSWWNLPDSVLKSNIKLFQNDNVDIKQLELIK